MNSSSLKPWLKLQITLVIWVMSIFTLSRLAFYFCYQEWFSALSLTDVVWALIQGTRFDISVAMTFMGIFLVGLCSPYPEFIASYAKKFCMASSQLLILVYATVLSVDLIYFPYVKRHIFDEPRLLAKDTGFIVESIFNSFLLESIGLILAVAIILYIQRPLWRLLSQAKPPNKLAPIFVFIICGLAVRGTLDPKPLNIVDAYASGNARQSELILNGVFTAWHASRNSSSEIPNYFESKEEAAIAAKYCLPGRDANHLFLDAPGQANFSEGSTRKNVVFILLESWFNDYIGSFGGRHKSITPEFDALAKRATRFQSFYANGSRSIEAIQTLLTGIPPLRGLPTLGLGFETTTMTPVARAAQQQGIETLFMQTSPRRSYRLNAIAAAMGFTHYYGREDYPLVQTYQDDLKPVFGYDYDMLQHLGDKLDGLSKPFFAFAFTGTTHTPFLKPPVLVDSENHGRETEIGFINTMRYADWSLGEFFRKIEKTPWYNNTIFMLTGDHTFPRYRDYSLRERHRVPLIIFDPSNPVGRDLDWLSSHADIAPTIRDMLRLNAPLATIGQSLQVSSPRRCVFLSGRFGNPGMLQGQSTIVHSGGSFLTEVFEDDCDSSCKTQLKNSLLGLEESLFRGVKNNTLMQ